MADLPDFNQSLSLMKKRSRGKCWYDEGTDDQEQGSEGQLQQMSIRNPAT